MKNPRKVAAIAAVVLIIAAGGLVRALNVLLAENRDQVRQELQKVIGKDVSFASLEVVWLGRPGFVAKEFRIVDDPRFAATPLMRAKELILGISVWHLFFQRLVIHRLTFIEPELQIIINETGLLNVTNLLQRKNELPELPGLRPEVPERRRAGVSFSVSQIEINQGRVEYIDRSTKEPSELRINHLQMTMTGFEPNVALQVGLTASLTEGLNKDLRIDGRVDPAPNGQPWTRRAVNLNLQIDSLYAPVVAHAIASLRDKIPSQLDVSGPMALKATVRGTAQRPRIDDITLKVPLFGSSDYNAIVTAAIAFSEQHTWADAYIKGKIVMAPLALARLRMMKSIESVLPEALVADGTIGAYALFEGTWENLRIGALVRADKAQLRYNDFFRKPVDVPAEIRARIYRDKNRLLFQDSQLILGANRVGFSGAFAYGEAPRLELKLRGKQEATAAWSEFFTASGLVFTAGKADWNVDFVKSWFRDEGTWSLQGPLKITGAKIEQKPTGASIGDLDMNISFAGKQARFDQVAFHAGQSKIFLNGVAENLEARRASYTMRSAQLNLAELPLLTASPPVQLHQVIGKGELQFRDDGLMLTGSITAEQASLYQFLLKNLRSDIVVTARAFTFKNLSAQMFNGVFQSNGYWSPAAGHLRQVDFFADAEGVNIGSLLAQRFPAAGKFDGLLNVRARFAAAAAEDASIDNTLNGSGEASVGQGVIKDFNPIAQLLLRGSGASAARLPPSLAALVDRPDTPFDSLKANFTVEQKRIRTENLVITTPDYTITGTGWVGFDLSTNWNGLMLISPRLTQDIQRDYRSIHYLLDRRGRLAISFHLDGNIPHLRIRLDNRSLAQALRAGKSGEKEADEKPAQETKGTRRWIPGALERFLNR